MRYRVVQIELTIWEDHPLFALTDGELAGKFSHENPMCAVGAKTLYTLDAEVDE